MEHVPGALIESRVTKDREDSESEQSRALTNRMDDMSNEDSNSAPGVTSGDGSHSAPVGNLMTDVNQMMNIFAGAFAQAMQSMLQQMQISAAPGQAQPERSTQPRNLPPLRPPPLSEFVQLGESPSLLLFEEWRKVLDNWALISHLEQYPKKEQIASAWSLLGDFQRIYDLNIKPTLLMRHPEPNLEEFCEAVQQYLRDQRSVLADRYDYVCRRQRDGESITNFITELRALERYTDFPDDAKDMLLVTLITAGIREKDLQKELLKKIPAPDLNETVQICLAHERAKADQAALSGAKCDAVTSKSTMVNVPADELESIRPRQQPRSHPNRRDERYTIRNNDEHFRRPCRFCGNLLHRQGLCRAKNAVCRFCGRRGHYEKACRNKDVHDAKDRSNQMQTGKRRTPKKVGIIKVRAVNSGKVRDAVAELEKRDKEWNRSLTVQICTGEVKLPVRVKPDTGAQVCVVPERLLPKLGLCRRLLQPSNTVLLSFDGSPGRVLGTFKAMIMFQQETVETLMFVVPKLDEPLISGRIAEELGIVAFPWKTCTAVLKKKVDNDVSPDKIETMKSQIMKEFRDVFEDADSAALRPMKGSPMKIHLREHSTPFCLTTARQVAHGLRGNVEKELDGMVKRGIIEPVNEPSEWCHPIVPVKKKNGGVRICVDFTRLNDHVARPFYPTRVPTDAVSAVRPEDRYFSTFDAVQGYWQMELATEDRHLTTFLSHCGRFRFRRSPMGLSSTGDEYCRRGDEAVRDLKDVEKVVDDILVHSPTLEQHLDSVRNLLLRCREHGITLNAKKAVFGQPEVKYVGFNVGAGGVKPDEKKLHAIRDFPAPTNITELRSFMGLANQLSIFTNELAEAAEPLRDLLKKKNVFLWLPEHQVAFEKVKDILCSVPALKAYDVKGPAAETILQTDSSRKGLGFALFQMRDGAPALIQAGSRFLTDAERNYAMIELELLAAVWAMHKCKVYLLGRDFVLKTDHRPLIPILQKGPASTENPRLLRLLQKVTNFSFQASWVKGKDNNVPDALSRAPVDYADDEDLKLQKELTVDLEARINAVLMGNDADDCTDNTRDLFLEDLAKSAAADAKYQSLVKTVQDGFPTSLKSLPLDSSIRSFYKLRNDLSVCSKTGLVLWGKRVVVPEAKRNDMLSRLHASHQGSKKMKQRAQETIFWPCITNDIHNIVDACTMCQEHRASLQKEALMTDDPPCRPFQEIAAEFFDFAGKMFLVVVDRYSGWIDVKRFTRHPTAIMFVDYLMWYFAQYGIPQKMRTDGALQFTAGYTAQFLKKYGVVHAVSAPHYPQSNGLAESAVKAAKALLKGTGCTDPLSEVFQRALLEFRCTPRAGKKSPALLVYGRAIRGLVPQYISEQVNEGGNDPKEEVQKSLCRTKKHRLAVGMPVRVQDHVTKRWNQYGTILKIRGRNIFIEMDGSGRTWWRNRRMVKHAADQTVTFDDK